jgi:heme/copper-type cytochrome/quinol oxidase subunit 2
VIRLRFAVLLITSLLWPLYAIGQGCSMCKTGAEAASTEQQKALNRGIVMLSVPSVLIFGGLFVLAFRFRASPAAKEKSAESGRDADLL